MRIVQADEFLELPEGTIFQYYLEEERFFLCDASPLAWKSENEGVLRVFALELTAAVYPADGPDWKFHDAVQGIDLFPADRRARLRFIIWESEEVKRLKALLP